MLNEDHEQQAVSVRWQRICGRDFENPATSTLMILVERCQESLIFGSAETVQIQKLCEEQRIESKVKVAQSNNISQQE